MKLNRATFKWICYPGGKLHLIGFYWDNLSIGDVYDHSYSNSNPPYMDPSIHPFYSVKPITELTIVHY